MIRISGVRVRLDEELTKETVAAHIGIAAVHIQSMRIVRKAIDARRKNDIHWVYAVEAKIQNEDRLLGRKNITSAELREYIPPPARSFDKRPIVVGSGPAGLFCALMLAYADARPIVLERGWDVDKRSQAVQEFWAHGKLDPECNVQFGEGGAGTFSDGKLTTGIKDIRCRKVLEEFCRFGADEDILYDAKPHIGTDKLMGIVKNMRQEIERLGGEFRFEHKLSGLLIQEGKIVGLEAAGPEGNSRIETDNVVVAIGHSARDTIRMLYNAGVQMEQKAFSIGARIEHRQLDIDRSQYADAAEKLPAADYKLAAHLEDGRGVYTFCMCPGGVVVAAASENGGVVTNGMSYHARDGENSNSALLVSVTPADFPGDHPLAGIAMQRQIEEKAWRAGGDNYFAPAQRVGDFLMGRPSNGPGRIQPTYRPGVKWGDIRAVLPTFAAEAMRRAIPVLDQRLRGFADPDAVLTVPETRSSSPVRICRDPQTLESTLRGIYPCGEGAGYAGGIMSAAVDGIRVFEAIMRNEAGNAGFDIDIRKEGS